MSLEWCNHSLRRSKHHGFISGWWELLCACIKVVVYSCLCFRRIILMADGHLKQLDSSGWINEWERERLGKLRLEASEQALPMIQTRHTEVNLGKWKWRVINTETTWEEEWCLCGGHSCCLPTFSGSSLWELIAWHFLVPLPLSGAMWLVLANELWESDRAASEPEHLIPTLKSSLFFCHHPMVKIVAAPSACTPL